MMCWHMDLPITPVPTQPTRVVLGLMVETICYPQCVIQQKRLKAREQFIGNEDDCFKKQGNGETHPNKHQQWLKLT